MIQECSGRRSRDHILITNDHDFGNVLVYPPEHTAGIVVLNRPGRLCLRLLQGWSGLSWRCCLGKMFTRGSAF